MTLKGTGIRPAVTLAPTNLAFCTPRSSPHTTDHGDSSSDVCSADLSIATAVLGGANAGDFALASGTTCINGATLAAGANCVLNLTFTPTAASARTATAIITDDAAGSPQSVSLTGTGVTPPTATLSATSSAFGEQRVGTTSPAQNVTLTNNGGAPLNLTSITITGAQAADFAFAAGNTCPTGAGSVAPGASGTTSISLPRAAPGARAAAVNITNDAVGSPQSVSLAGTGIAPAVTLAPANLAFGTQRVSTPSPMQTVTLTNSGTAPLSIATAVLGGANAGDFALASGTTCINGATLAAGANCVLNLTFTPTAPSARTATVIITDDAAGGPQSVSLAGTGIAPAVTLAPANLAFGTQRLSTPSPVQTVTLTNSGTAPLRIATAVLGGANAGDFALASGTPCINGATPAAGATCVLTLTLPPTPASARTATVTITDDAAGSPQSVSLTGTGVTPPTATLSATSSAFGEQRVGTTSPAQSVTLTNNGGAPLNLTSITITGAQAADFGITADNTCPTGAGSVAPGASCTISVSFTPLATGIRNATLNIVDDASGSPHTITLTGTGIAPAVTLSANTVAFGNQRVGTTSSLAQTVTLTNGGTATLNLTSITRAGASPGDFAVAGSGTTPCPLAGGSVAASASCTFTLTFTPAAPGARAATVNITDDAAGSPQTVSLSGTGTVPAVTLSATSLAYGNQRVGTTSAGQNVTLTNNDAAPLNLTSITITGAQAADFAFAAGNTCPTGAGSVTPGASCTIGVSFTPAAPGARAAAVNITDDAVGSPQSVSLAGTGIAPAVTLAPTNLAFGTQRVSTPSPVQTVTLTNSGDRKSTRLNSSHR